MKRYLVAILMVGAAGVMLWDFFIVPRPLAGFAVFDPQNATYEIGGAHVVLKNGNAEAPAAPGSASKISTRYFGNVAEGDLNGDGAPDMAFLITQETCGSGLFYYVVAALADPSGYKATPAFYVGDRIAPQSTEIDANLRELRINYSERKPDEPMATQPSVGTTLYLKVTPAGLLEGIMK